MRRWLPDGQGLSSPSRAIVMCTSTSGQQSRSDRGACARGGGEHMMPRGSRCIRHRAWSSRFSGEPGVLKTALVSTRGRLQYSVAACVARKCACRVRDWTSRRRVRARMCIAVVSGSRTWHRRLARRASASSRWLVCVARRVASFKFSRFPVLVADGQHRVRRGVQVLDRRRRQPRAVGLRCALGAAGRPHDTGPGPTSWAFVWAPHAPVSSWVIGSDHCQPGWSCNWHWTGVSPGGGVSGETSGAVFLPEGVSRGNTSDQRFPREGVSRGNTSEQRFPREGVSRGNASETFPPGGGLSGKRLGATVPPGGGLSGKCRGSAFPPGGGVSGKSSRSNVSPRRGSLGEMPRSVTLRPLAGAQAEPESARRRNSCRGRREAPEETLYCAVQIRARNTCLLYRRTKGRSTCSRRHA